MANILYRASITPTVPGTTSFKGSALTNDEIDGNFKSIANELSTLTTNYTNKTGDTLTGALNFAPPATIVSSATVAIGASGSNNVTITGTTTITAFDTAANGAIRFVLFTGILTLTHNATSLILPGGGNITTSAGDTAVFVSLGSGNWRCISYTVNTGRTGTGALVYASSPTFVTPTLGTPASGTLTNCTFPTLNQSTTGNAATATLATKSSTLSAGGGNGTAITFTYTDPGGQPTYFWGTSAVGATAIYTIANLSVNSANTATSATNVTGIVAIANGGTGASTATGAVTALNRGVFSIVSTSGGVMTAGSHYSVYTSGGAITMYLPTFANSVQGDVIQLTNMLHSWGAVNFTVASNTNSFIRVGASNETSLVCDINIGGFMLVCAYKDGTTAYWNVV